MIYRTRPAIGMRYANRSAPGFSQPKHPTSFFGELDRASGHDTQTGTHRAFLSENLQLPFLADSTGHWDAIHKPIHTGLSSANTVNCLLRTRPGTGMRYANRSAWSIKIRAACGTPYFFTFHSSLFPQKSPGGQVFFLPAGLFSFFRVLFAILILTFIYVSSTLSYRQISM